jgi:pimeloyl-ACP methyl ester carboxylesterase
MDGRISVDSVELAYTLSGRGPSIVLLHGWMCNRKFWKKQIEVLSQTRQVLTLDFRGHGDSDVAKDGYTIEQLADDVCEVLKGLEINRTVVVGHSMGGMVAQQFCLSHKNYVAALILVTTIAADPEGHLISKRIERDAHHLGFRNAFLQHFDGWFGATTESNMIHWVREQMLHTPETVGLNLVLAYRRFDLRTHLPNLRLPTLVIGTTLDASAVPVEAEILAELIPGANLVMIEEAGHFPMLENPQALNKAMEAFLSTVE